MNKSHTIHRKAETTPGSDSECNSPIENLKELVYRADPETLMATYVNSAIERIYGYTKEEWLENNVLREETIHPEDKQRVLTEFAEAKQKLHNGVLEYRIIRKDKHVRWVEDHITWQINPDGEIISLNGVMYDVTERKRAENALRMSEENFRSFVEASEDMIFQLDRTGQIEYINPNVMKFCGYQANELIGKSIQITTPAEELPRAMKAIQRVLSGESVKYFQINQKSKTGQIVPIEINATGIVKDGQTVGIRGIARDLTERKKFSEKLERKQRTIEAIFDAAPVGMLLVDKDIIVKRVNERFRQMVCKEYSQIIDRRPGDALNCVNNASDASGCGYTSRCKKCDLRRAVERVLDTGQSVRRVEFQATIKVGDKELKPWLCLSAEPVEIDSCMRVVIAIDDISDSKKAEEALKIAKEEVERTNLQLKSAANQSEQLAEKAAVAADQAKSGFLANMSHEIRTSMHAIMGFSELLAGPNLTDDQEQCVGMIHECGQTFLQLIDNILDLSKIESGKMDVEMTACSLGHLLAVVESMMRPRAKEKGLVFDVVLCGDLPLEIYTDSLRLRQCLVNLVNNAIKFTEAGHVYVKVSLRQLNDKFHIRFDVEDTGVGIPSEKIESIFEAFMQVDMSNTRQFSGPGLGLAITKRLTDLLGGELSVTSEVGKGSIFTLQTPVGLDIEAGSLLNRMTFTHNFQEMPGSDEQYQFKGKILVAEDSPYSQKLMRILLEKAGLEVTLVENGRDAIDKASCQQFDLILMDIQMPVVNGYEATRMIRKKGVSTPIIALTAHAMKDDEQKCISAGCNRYLAKPVGTKQLFEAVGEFLSVHQDTLSS